MYIYIYIQLGGEVESSAGFFGFSSRPWKPEAMRHITPQTHFPCSP